MNTAHTRTASIDIPESGGIAADASRVLRNTYRLLGLTLATSAIAAGTAIASGMPHPGLLITLAGYFGLLFLTYRLRNSAWGLAAVFALTAFMGATLGPVISRYLALPGGHQIVMMAMGATALIFIALSTWATTSRRDFSFLGGFLTVGILCAFFAGLGAVLFSIPALALTVSAAFVLLMGGLILYQTSEIVRGGETNYILATVTLYVSIYNLFSTLLQLLGVVNADD